MSKRIERLSEIKLINLREELYIWSVDEWAPGETERCIGKLTLQVFISLLNTRIR